MAKNTKGKYRILFYCLILNRYTRLINNCRSRCFSCCKAANRSSTSEIDIIITSLLLRLGELGDLGEVGDDAEDAKEA